MAYDEELADRIRELLGGEADLSEKKMFGGFAFLIGGHRRSPRVARVVCWFGSIQRNQTGSSPSSNARLMEMRGGQMEGWLRVAPDDVRTKRQLAKWVKFGATYARSLPAKR